MPCFLNSTSRWGQGDHQQANVDPHQCQLPQLLLHLPALFTCPTASSMLQKSHHKLKPQGADTLGVAPFPTIPGLLQAVSVLAPQPHRRAARRCPEQVLPPCVCHTSQRQSHSPSHQDTPCEKVHFTRKCQTEALPSSWGHLPDWRSRVMLCSTEAAI